MTEIVTESFCERCGTRYSFEPVETGRPLASLGTFSRGIRHFFTEPGSTLGESFAVARSETEQRATNNALEAFHQTFNFCLNCRQYVCGECWNAVEGRCLSCAPVAAAEPPPAATLVMDAPMGTEAGLGVAAPHIEVIGAAEAAQAAAAAAAASAAPPAAEAPPLPDESGVEGDALAALLGPLPTTPAASRLASDGTAAEAAAPVEAAAEIPSEVVPTPLGEAAALAGAGAPARESAAAGMDAALVDLEPGRSLDAEIAAYEELRAGTQPAEAEVVEAVAEEPEAVVAATMDEAEVVAAAAPAAEVVAPEPEIAAAETPVTPEPEAAPEPQPTPEVVVDAWPEPTPVGQAPWRAAPPIGDDRIAAISTPASADGEERVEPVAAAARSPLESLPPILGPRSVPDASPARAPVATGARNCPACGLSISVSARFCRRCGTAQQQAG